MGRRPLLEYVYVHVPVYGGAVERARQCMRTQRVYLDTSVSGGCCDDEFAKWSNGIVADVESGLIRVASSAVVAAWSVRSPAAPSRTPYPAICGGGDKQ